LDFKRFDAVVKTLGQLEAQLFLHVSAQTKQSTFLCGDKMKFSSGAALRLNRLKAICGFSRNMAHGSPATKMNLPSGPCATLRRPNLVATLSIRMN
jgi:hypothetical protein